MTTKKPPTHTHWHCPKCDLTYINPIPASAVSHRCSAVGGSRVKLKPVKKEEGK